MAKCMVSAVIAAPIEKVWLVVRDFGQVPYFAALSECSIVGGGRGDTVGCIRAARWKTGLSAKERLTGLSDVEHKASYELIEVSPEQSFSNYAAEMQLLPITLLNQTFIQWWSTYDVAPQEEAATGQWIQTNIYQKCIEGIKRLVE